MSETDSGETDGLDAYRVAASEFIDRGLDSTISDVAGQGLII